METVESSYWQQDIESISLLWVIKEYNFLHPEPSVRLGNEKLHIPFKNAL